MYVYIEAHILIENNNKLPVINLGLFGLNCKFNKILKYDSLYTLESWELPAYLQEKYLIL